MFMYFLLPVCGDVSLAVPFMMKQEVVLPKIGTVLQFGTAGPVMRARCDIYVYVCIRMYVCMYVCMYHTYVCMHVCRHIYNIYVVHPLYTKCIHKAAPQERLGPSWLWGNGPGVNSDRSPNGSSTSPSLCTHPYIFITIYVFINRFKD